jgi:hypothetical protein
VVQRHLLEQTQRGAKLLTDRRRGVVIQDLFDEDITFESGRRDRGVGVGSKVTPVHPRHECREQFTLSQ